VRLYWLLHAFVFGFALTLLLTSLSKVIFGSLRPHFIAVCKPIIPPERSAIRVSPCLITNSFGKLGDWPCANNAASARLSFFSGHSSTCAFAATYGSLIFLRTLLPGWRSSHEVSLLSLPPRASGTDTADGVRPFDDARAGMMRKPSTTGQDDFRRDRSALLTPDEKRSDAVGLEQSRAERGVMPARVSIGGPLNAAVLANGLSNEWTFTTCHTRALPNSRP